MKRKKVKNKIIIFSAMTMLLLSAHTITYGAAPWWGGAAYEYAITNGLTSIRTTNSERNSQLKRDVSLSDLYTTILKYLELKGIAPKDRIIHHKDEMNNLDNVAKGIFNIVNDYNSKKQLTVQQYYIVENYVEHGRKTLEQYMDYSQYLTRDKLKNIDLYLALSKYQAATLIDDRAQRTRILSELGNIKNTGIIRYHILPYVSDISRQEFLLLMYDLLSDKSASDAEVIKAFQEADILRGFDTGLELDKPLTYREMYTFLYRFENFDFQQNKLLTEEETEE